MRYLAALVAIASLCMIAQESVATDFIGHLTKGEFVAASEKFDERVAAALPPDKLSAVWSQVQSQAGKYVKQESMRSEAMGTATVYTFPSKFQNATLDLLVTVSQSGKIAGFFIKQHTEVTAAPPAQVPIGVVEKSVELEGLPAKLTLPKGAGPFAAAVLVPGSGPNDMDETVGANKPFRDMAWGLAVRGIATLRFDKRSKVFPAALKHGTVKEEEVDDSIAALAMLRKTPEVDPKRVFLIGHSLGGMLMPRIAKLTPDAAGYVIMAANTRALEDVILTQLEYLGAPNLTEMRTELAKVRTLKPGDAAVMGAPAEYWIDLRDYHQAEEAKRIEKPLLVLQGERDYQISMGEFEGWRKALAGKPNVTFKSYPGLNHLFITGEGRSLPAEYEKPGHVSDAVLNDLTSWIKSGKLAT